jgi:hypothetical protein
MLCAGGLLSIAIFVAQILLLKNSDRKEKPMEHTEKNSSKSCRVWNAFLLTTTAVGAEFVSGATLLG